MSSSGIVPINGGSVILRTYLDESAENTYLLQQYDVPISSNRILITSTNGLLISTTTINVSSVGTSSIFANTVSTNQLFICTIYYSTFTSSQLNYENTIANNISASTINFITMRGGTISTLLVNTKSLGINDGTFSTLIVPSLTASSINVDRLTTINGRYNTLIGPNMKLNILSTVFFYISSVFVDVVTYDIISSKTITASTLFMKNDRFTNATGKILETSILIAPSVTTKSVVFSTMVLGSFYELRQFAASEITTSSLYSFKGECSTIMIGSTIGGSTIFTPPLNVYNNQVVSSATGNSILISTLTTASTLYGSNNVFTTLTGSSTFATNAIVPSLTTNSIQFSTIYTPTANIPLVYASTLIIQTPYINASLTVSTMIAGTTRTSTMITNNVPINMYYINQAVYGTTLKKDSIYAFSAITLNSSDISGSLDNGPLIQQQYTMGPTIPNLWVATGNDNSTVMYSYDGQQWFNTSKADTFDSIGSGAAWNGQRWVAVGSGTNNSISISDNGTSWTGKGKTALDSGQGIAWGNNLWVAVGGGGPSGIAISGTGDTWTNINANLGILGYDVAWNGRLFVIVGNKFAHSYTGNAFILSTQPFVFTFGNGVAWNGRLWIAVGGGPTNSIAWSKDGINWTGLGKPVFTMGFRVAWNGLLWIAGGSGGTSPLAGSYDGLSWFSINVAGLFTTVNGVAWNGTMWIAVGYGPSLIAYSYDGINWTAGFTAFSNIGQGIAFNYRRPYTLTANLASITVGSVPGVSLPISVSAGSQLDIVSDSYYNRGYTNFSLALQTRAS